MSGTNIFAFLRKKIQERQPQMPDAPVIDRAGDANQARLAGLRATAFASGTEGRQGTLLTGPSGLTTDATTKRKTLLGS